MWVRGCEQGGGPAAHAFAPSADDALSRRQRRRGGPSLLPRTTTTAAAAKPPSPLSLFASLVPSSLAPAPRRPPANAPTGVPKPCGVRPGRWMGGARRKRPTKRGARRKTDTEKERKTRPPPLLLVGLSPTCGFWWALRRVLTVRAAPGAAEGTDEGAASISLSLSLSRSPPAAAVVPVRGIPFFFCSVLLSPAESGICYVWGSERMKGAAVCQQGWCFL